MGTAARDDRSGRYAADAAPQRGDRRGRAHDGGDAGRDPALRRLRPPVLSRRGARGAGASVRPKRSTRRFAGRPRRSARGSRSPSASSMFSSRLSPSRLCAARWRRSTTRPRSPGLSAMTNLTGSALLALATAHGFLAAEEAWRAAHVDEDFQNEFWGVDEEAGSGARRGGARLRRRRSLAADAPP